MQDAIVQPALLANSTYVFIGAFVDELQRTGLQHVVICPGSRSTPLAITFAQQREIRCWTHVDERSAGFFALGMAKRLSQPVALLCTSGTAAANFLPALVEARLSHIPLLVLTADRPHELRDCGAPQSIDQHRLYGTHVKWFVDLALPEATDNALRSIRTMANRAMSQARAVPPGPVHLNVPLREPLTPEPIPDQPLPALSQRDPLAWYGRPNNHPYIVVRNAPLASASVAAITQLAALGKTTARGLIIVGPQDDPQLALPLVNLAEQLGYPILADPLSQLRCGSHDQRQIISSYDAFLRSETFIEHAAPELILRFGAMPTAKPLLLYLTRYATCPQVVIDGYGGWEEPTQRASELIHANPVTFCQELATALTTSNTPGFEQSDTQLPWLATWQQADQQTRQALHTALQDFKQPFEGRVFTELSELLPAGALLYIGNSMPIRDMDTFFWSNSRSIRTFGNRGANGIDGIISSALGASAVSTNAEPTLLVIGDISFFHDLNGLLAAHLHRLNLVIVLINNDGGGIFSFLPQAAYPEHFEQLFGTPTGLQFEPLVQAYGGRFITIKDWKDFSIAVKQGFETGGLHVIQVQTERASNVSMHRSLWQVVEQTLNNNER